MTVPTDSFRVVESKVGRHVLNLIGRQMAHQVPSKGSAVASAHALRTSGYLGLLVTSALVFLLPWLLASQLSLQVAPGWGLGNLAFAFCAAGALIGMFVGRRMKF